MPKAHALAQELAEVCDIDIKDAQSILSKYKNDLNRAVDAVFNGQVKVSRSKASATKITSIFNKYKDSDDEIGIAGTINYLKDLDTEPEEPVVLTLACKLESPGEGRFSKSGFVNGWKNLGADTLAGMKEQVDIYKRELVDRQSTTFEQTYEFTFKYNLQEGQRMLPLETAMAYWGLLLEGKFSKLDQWLEFVSQEYKKSISRDTWKMVLEFARYVDEDPTLANYDPEGAWPSVIDEFVDYVRAK